MKNETLGTILIATGTLFLIKIVLDDTVLCGKKDELKTRLEDAMKNYKSDSKEFTKEKKDEINTEYDSLCARLVKSSYDLFVNKKLERDIETFYNKSHKLKSRV